MSGGFFDDESGFVPNQFQDQFSSEDRSLGGSAITGQEDDSFYSSLPDDDMSSVDRREKFILKNNAGNYIYTWIFIISLMPNIYLFFESFTSPTRF